MKIQLFRSGFDLANVKNREHEFIICILIRNESNFKGTKLMCCVLYRWGFERACVYVLEGVGGGGIGVSAEGWWWRWWSAIHPPTHTLSLSSSYSTQQPPLFP